MATRKTQQAEAEKEMTTETPEEVTTENAEAEEVQDPWDVTVEVFVPRARKGEDPNAYVCVNDRRFSIPRNGKTQKMPAPVAEVLQMGLEAEYKAQEYAESIQVHEPVPGSIA